MIKGKKILVIDDTQSIRTFLKISLEAQEAEFYEASTAEEGMRMNSKFHPDVIILDLGLPDKDGLDIINELKLVNSGRQTSLIILSVRKDQIIKSRALSLGADAYLNKPFIVEELISEIYNQLYKQAKADET